jgi:hypothetical protein
MSNNTWKLIGHGLLVAACSGLTFAITAEADEPVPRGRASAPAPKAAEERYLLLSDGRLIRGVIAHDDTAYTVTQSVGVIRYPNQQVERAFDSVQEAYGYRLQRVPEDDPAERLSLARWCLSLHLDKEARTLLEQVVEISPNHGPARAMLTKMNQAEAARVARNESKIDAGVQKTGGEEIAEDRPGALDSAVLKGAERRMGITGLPVIFDLPPAVAVRCAEQFKQYVHPVLQAYCAKCHDANYDGMFQLVPVKTARQRTPDAIRANLDAALRLIDRENPAKSELLSSTLRPHGIGVKARPIFSGSNDRAYRILATWVTSLRPPNGFEPPDPAGARTPSDSGEAFAADHNRSGGDVLDEIARNVRSGEARQPRAIRNPTAGGAGAPSYRYVEGQGMVPEESGQADPREFPLPYMIGGPRPDLPAAAASRGNGRGQQPIARRAADPGSTRPALPVPGDAPAQSDGIDPTVPDTRKPPAANDARTSAAKKKPVKIDPKILEKLLQGNANRAVGQ